MAVRTRFAPSPTGHLHIGGVRTALFSWLYARHHGGQFVLRIEDTDRERSTPESVQAILDGLAWLGLDWDEGPHFQTRRFERYREVLDQMLEAELAYRCYCTREELAATREAQRARGEKPRYDRRCRQGARPRPGIEPVLRFRNPLDGAVVIDDVVKGRVTIRNDELDDLIIARSDGTPTYNFTVVVDDRDMEITHVIRGDDHLNNTPRQINMLRALGARVPIYAHVPMILGADGKRLSKRHGAVNVLAFRQQGVLPEALLNYLARLGWSHGDQEVFSRQEMIALFDIEDVNAAASTFDPNKLSWLNQHYLKSLPAEVLAERARSFFTAVGIDVDDGPALTAVVRAQQGRSKTLVEMAEKSVCLYGELGAYDDKAAAKHLTSTVAPWLEATRQALAALESWQAEAIHGALQSVVDSAGVGFGKIAQPVRVAVTGGVVSPAIDVTLELVGRQRSLARLGRALEYIQGA